MNPFFNKLLKLGVNFANQKLKDPNFQKNLEKSIMENETFRSGIRKFTEKRLDYQPPPGSKENPDYYAGKKLREDVDKVINKIPDPIKNFATKEVKKQIHKKFNKK